MRKEDVMEKIRTLHSSMRFLTLQSGITQKSYDDIITDLDLKNSKQLNDLWTKLKDAASGPYAALFNMQQFYPLDVRQRYVLLGITDTDEHKQFNAIVRELKKVYKPEKASGSKKVRQVA